MTTYYQNKRETVIEALSHNVRRFHDDEARPYAVFLSVERERTYKTFYRKDSYRPYAVSCECEGNATFALECKHMQALDRHFERAYPSVPIDRGAFVAEFNPCGQP